MTRDEIEKALYVMLPCWCGPEYKDRKLIAPDCPRCQFGPDVVDVCEQLMFERSNCGTDHPTTRLAPEAVRAQTAHMAEQLEAAERLTNVCPKCRVTKVEGRDGD